MLLEAVIPVGVGTHVQEELRCQVVLDNVLLEFLGGKATSGQRL